MTFKRSRRTNLILDEDTGKQNKFKQIKKYLPLTGAFLLIGVIGWIIGNYSNRPQFVSFDVKKTTNTFLLQIAKLPLDDEQKKMMTRRYERVLSGVIAEYESQNKIVFSSSAIVTNVEDKTNEIKAKIAERMREKQGKDQ